MKDQRGVFAIWIVLTAILMLGLIGGAFYLGMIYRQNDQTITGQVSTTPSPESTNFRDVKLRGFATADYSLVYPLEWKFQALKNVNYKPDQFVIYSPDIELEESDMGGITKGAVISLIVDEMPISEQLNVQYSEEETDWLGVKAVKRKFQFNGYYTELIGEVNGKRYILSMVAKSDNPASYQSAFDYTANGLRIYDK